MRPDWVLVVRLTVPENPERPVTVTDPVPEDPARKVRGFGLAEMLKSCTAN